MRLVHDHEDGLQSGLEVEVGDGAQPGRDVGGLLAHAFSSSPSPLPS